MFSHPENWCWFVGRCPHHQLCHILCVKMKRRGVNVNQVWTHADLDQMWNESLCLPDRHGAVCVNVFYSLNISVQLRVTVEIGCTAPLQVNRGITQIRAHPKIVRRETIYILFKPLISSVFVQTNRRVSYVQIWVMSSLNLTHISLQEKKVIDMLHRENGFLFHFRRHLLE